MKVEDVIAFNVRVAREELGLTRAQMSAEIGKWLSRPWSRQTASIVESGKRAFAAEELSAVALVLRRPVASFFRVPFRETVEMPSGATVDAKELAKLMRTGVDAAREDLFDEIMAAKREAERTLRDAQRTLHHLELAETVYLVASGQVRVETDFTAST